MTTALPKIVLVRHGETAWSRSGRHTGLTDLPLTEEGEKAAMRLREHLPQLEYQRVLTSPLQRARETAALAGYPAAEVQDDLCEWNYGMLEGQTSVEIRQQFPGWTIFQDGSPRGESVAQAMARADRVVAQLKERQETTLIFCHGHFSRVIAARWCGLTLDVCGALLLSTTAYSILGYDRDLDHPVIRSWNVLPETPAHHPTAMDGQL